MGEGTAKTKGGIIMGFMAFIVFIIVLCLTTIGILFYVLIVEYLECRSYYKSLKGEGTE